MSITEELKKEIGKAILNYGAIRYVNIAPNDGFFLIKFPGFHIQDNEPQGATISIHPPMLRNRAKLPINSCAIFYNGKLYHREKDKTVEKVLRLSYASIYDSPEFLISNFFEEHTTETTIHLFKGSKGQTYGECEFKDAILIPRVGVKISSPKHFRPICDLLRQIGLLKESRGKIKPVDKITERLKKFLLKEFKSIKKKSYLPIKTLQKRLQAEIDKLFPDNPKEAEKYYWSDSTLRRVLKSFIKK